jgi:hypothetical protein
MRVHPLTASQSGSTVKIDARLTRQGAIGIVSADPSGVTSGRGQIERRSTERGRGDVAQLVEHLLCKQGVGGSSPLVSTGSITRYGGAIIGLTM